MTSNAETTRCPSCLAAVLRHEPAGPWSRCASCRSEFRFPVPSAKTDVERALSTDASVATAEPALSMETPAAMVERLALLPGASILDLRCGLGLRLRDLKGRGLKLFGVEADPLCRSLAEQRLGLNATVVASLERLVPHAFDIVLMDGVIDQAFDASQVFYQLFALGAIVPSTRVVLCAAAPGVVDCSTRRQVVSRYSKEGASALLERLHFRVDRLTLDDSEDAQPPRLTLQASGSDFTAFMQERYVPGTWSKIAEYEHLPRYQFSLSRCCDKRVLDFGSGTGYGSAILAGVAASVTGVDIDANAIAWARATHHHVNLSFDLRADFAEGLEAAAFDVITCFEMIEHVAEAEQLRTIASFKRLLRPDGVLIISTPNPDVTAQYGANPYHLKEMTRSEFEALLLTSFAQVEVLDQTVLSSVTMTSAKTAASAMTLSYLGQDDVAAPLAFMALCSPGDQLSAAPSVMFDRSSDVIHEFLLSARLSNELKFGQYQLSERLLEERHAALRDKEAAIRSLKEEIALLRGSRLVLLGHALKKRQLLWAARLLLGAAVPSGWRATRVALTQTPDVLVTAPRMVLQKDASLPEQAYALGSPARTMSLRPRVLHAIANFMIGGSSRLVVDLIEQLGASYQQRVITAFVPNPPAYHGVDITELNADRAQDHFDQVIAAYEPDILHVHYWGDTDLAWYKKIFIAADRHGVRVIQNVNTPVEPYPMAGAENVFVSQYVQRTFGAAARAARVIYPGSDFELFSAPAGGLQDGDCVGMVYRLEHDKLAADAIEPFIETVRQRPRTKVLVVGDGRLLPGFKARVAAQGMSASFEFKGYVPYRELPGLYRRMSLFMAPVHKESFGQVTPFAMSMGIAVIGYDVGAIGEILDDRSLLAKAGDAKALAEIAVALLDQPQRRIAIGVRNQARAAALFSLSAMIDQYRLLYAQLLLRPHL